MADEKKQEQEQSKPKYKLDKSGKVRVRIMNAVGRYEHGKEYDITPEEAELICNVRSKHDGHEVVKYRCAIPLYEIEELKKKKVEEGGLTQGELTELGMKNVVQTPRDKEFEARLKAIQEGKPAVGEELDEDGLAQAKAAQDKKMNEAKAKVLGQGKESA